MINHQDALLQIRALREDDSGKLAQAFAKQGWQKPKLQFEKYFEEQQRRERQVFVAIYEGEIAGYVTLLPQARYGPFKGMPEVCDFNVLIKYQQKGIGSRLLDVLEDIVKSRHSVITLGVGLHNGYGPAQRMYIKRGYIPDGSGVWYGNQIHPKYTVCCNDDDLILYLSKKLR